MSRRRDLRRRIAELAAEVQREAASGSESSRVDVYREDPARLMLDARFTPDPWQKAFLASRDRMTLMLCARQVGKSLAVSFLALHELLTNPGGLTTIVAQRQDQAAEMLRKAATAFYKIGSPLPVKASGATHFELANGARILALPGEEKAMHGPTSSLLVIDEAARVPDSVYHAASPQLSASGGRMVALSTAFTKSGWFYKEWTQGLGWRKWSITARECPRHSPEFLERERRSMGDRWFAMAYLNEFGDDVAAVFSAEDIAAMRSESIAPLFPDTHSRSRSPAGAAAAAPTGGSGIRPLFA